jgi:hypothetical protein
VTQEISTVPISYISLTTVMTQASQEQWAYHSLSADGIGVIHIQWLPGKITMTTKMMSELSGAALLELVFITIDLFESHGCFVEFSAL